MDPAPKLVQLKIEVELLTDKPLVGQSTPNDEHLISLMVDSLNDPAVLNAVSREHENRSINASSSDRRFTIILDDDPGNCQTMLL